MTQSDEDFVDDLDDLDDLDDDNLDELNPPAATRSTSERGLTKDEKQLLLRCLDKKGGIVKCSRESGIVEEICNWKPAIFGLANSPKRKATQTVITKWKQHARKKNFDKIRDELEVPKPKNICDDLSGATSITSAPKTRSKKAATTKAAATTTTTTAPVKSISLSMTSITSPAKLMRKKKSASRAAEDIEGMSVDWLDLPMHYFKSHTMFYL